MIGNAVKVTRIDAGDEPDRRDDSYAHEFLQDVASRLANWVQLTIDLHRTISTLLTAHSAQAWTTPSL